MTGEGARALVIGMGGLGCPAALALAHCGIGTLGICDDDPVDESNLHRQILFGLDDVGLPKVAAAGRRLGKTGARPRVRVHATRFLPYNAMALVRDYDVVLEGSDNFATKFLCADSCARARVGVVHAAAVRWVGTVLAVGPQGRPCYRCLFEDPPPDGAPGCSEAGVMGPVVGVVAALQVDLALALLEGRSVAGEVATFDGRSGVLRRHRLKPRGDCVLCGRPAGTREPRAPAAARPD